MIRAVFFDFGGTLMDNASDASAHLALMRSVKERYGLPSSPEDMVAAYDAHVRPLYENRDERWLDHDGVIVEAFRAILASEGEQIGKQDDDWFLAEYLKCHVENVVLLPGAELAVKAAGKMAGHVGIISDSDTAYLEYQMRALGIHPYFDSVTTSQDAGAGKPNPRIFELALEKAECRGNEAVYVGDRENRDIFGAKALGMGTILVLPEKVPTAADYHVASPEGVPEVLRRMADQTRGEI